ncbi:MAG TPA: hypothetical protein P5096_03235 [Patescibacteria group bacterium]|nr:hypothetical protein [Patescibacteria group bacterium]
MNNEQNNMSKLNVSEIKKRMASREGFTEVSDKIKKFGELGLNIREHHSIYSTPPGDLIRRIKCKEDEDKTLGELMSDEEILERLDYSIKFYNYFKDDIIDNLPDDVAKDTVMGVRENLPKDIAYLRSIGRLPEKYRDFLKE